MNGESDARGIVSNADTTISVDTGSVISASYIGTGLHFAPYEVPITDADWSTVLTRVNFMNPKYARVMIAARFYSSGLDSSGNPVYSWNSSLMQGTYKMLDYCQAHGISVIFGEWEAPNWKSPDLFPGIGATSPKWSRMIADCLAYLHDTKGYTCIKYYNVVNEPNGSWSGVGNFADWKTAVDNLYSELGSRGMLSWIKISGPDSTGADSWVDSTVSGLNGKIGIYDVHRYDSVSNVESGNFESEMSAKRAVIPSDKAFCLNETGLIDGKDEPNDSQLTIDTHNYGIHTLDMVIQSIRAGMAAQINWDLDDAQHVGGGYGSDNLKKWGFWNMYGGRDGYPASDRNPRPWFYTWSLMSRYFPQGGQTLVTNYSSAVQGIRATAIRKANGANWDFTFAVVNDSDTARVVNVVVPNATSTCVVSQYNYKNGNSPVDGNLLPVPDCSYSVDFASGTSISLAARSAFVLTTMNGGSALSLGSASSDLAFGKSASSTSVDDSSRGPEKAFDGNSSTRWSSAYVDTASIQVDLGQIVSVSRVRLNWETAYAKKFQIQTSTDGTSWQTVYSNYTGTGGINDISFGATNARWVKMYAFERATSWGYSLWDFNIYR